MEAGQVIAGKYRLNRIIGAGGMASVWSATNVFTERQFAIKVLLPQVGRSAEAKKRFLLEAKVSARIDHPNVIEIIDVGQAEDGSLFLVMELLTGASLETALRRQVPPMTMHQLALVMLEVARALTAAHRNGVIHRDLKPTNIFLHQDREGHTLTKVLDFGVSKVLEDESLHALTVAGTVLGSPLYMSPEQAAGASNVDGRTDVFAFGAILFEALCGVRCYDAPNFNALIVAIATTQPRSIDELAPHVPEPLRALVRDCLVSDKKKRTATFSIVVERLEAMLDELEASALRIPSPTVVAPPSDPDATAQMVSLNMSKLGERRRGSDRPPAPPAPAALQPTPVPVSRSRDGSGGAGWATRPSALMAGVFGGAFTRRWWLMAGAGFLGTTFVLGVGFVVVGRAGTAPVAQAPAARAAEPPPAALVAPQPSSGGPVIDVDSLPVAAAQASSVAATGLGKLMVGAAPGWYEVVLDGVPRGATPLPPLDVPTGPHEVECRPPGGKARVAKVTVQDGATAHYKFALEP